MNKNSIFNKFSSFFMELNEVKIKNGHLRNQDKIPGIKNGRKIGFWKKISK